MTDSLLHIASAGAKQMMYAQAVSTNNLANVNTRGFRADQYQPLTVTLDTDGLSSETYPGSNELKTDFTPGGLITTGRNLDIAVEGDGWIAVQKSNGEEAYTRTGDLRIDVNGQLRTSSGHLVLGNGGPISIPPAESITVGRDGNIQIRPLGQSGNALATVDRIKLVKPELDNFKKGEDALFHTMDGKTLNPDGSLRVVPGALENSNVNAVSEMVNIINFSRQYEMQVKLMKQYDETGDALTQLLGTQ
jgi:flagellar basal-body rod protein FlgF